MSTLNNKSNLSLFKFNKSLSEIRPTNIFLYALEDSVSTWIRRALALLKAGTAFRFKHQLSRRLPRRLSRASSECPSLRVYLLLSNMAVDLANPQWKSSVVENFTVAFLLQNLSSPFSLKVFGCWPYSCPPSMHCRLFSPTVHFKRIHPLKHLYTEISDFWRQFLVIK